MTADNEPFFVAYFFFGSPLDVKGWNENEERFEGDLEGVFRTNFFFAFHFPMD